MNELDGPVEHVAQTGDSAEMVNMLDWFEGPKAEAYFGPTFALRLLALAWVTKPESFNGDSLSQIARKRGITVQALSRYTVLASRIFGLRNRSQEICRKRCFKKRPSTRALKG